MSILCIEQGRIYVSYMNIYVCTYIHSTAKNITDAAHVHVNGQFRAPVIRSQARVNMRPVISAT